jgi:hypothetical protein
MRFGSRTGRIYRATSVGVAVLGDAESGKRPERIACITTSTDMYNALSLSRVGREREGSILNILLEKNQYVSSV